MDAGEWMPAQNKCWFANRVIEIKAKNYLSVNQAEVDALKAVLDSCESIEMIFFPKTAHGIAPVRREHAAYDFMDDRDNNGVVCE